MSDEAPITVPVGETPDEKLDRLRDEIQAAQAPQASSERLNQLLRQYTQTYLAVNGGAQAIGNMTKEDIVTDVAASLGLSDQSSKIVVQGEIDAAVRSHTGLFPDTPESGRHVKADPVVMFSGQYVHEAQDLQLGGAGIDFVFRRTYKNQVNYSGPLGANWDHGYNLYLREIGGEVVLSTGGLREEAYTRHPRFGEAGFTYFVPPAGVHAVLEPAGDSWTRRGADGWRCIFERDPATGNGHRLRRIEDRFGNHLSFAYTDGRLDQVLVNHPARWVGFAYDEHDRIVTVHDHTGRTWRYDYDDLNDLVGVTTPATDQYPSGLTTQYEYSTAMVTAALLQHNLVRILDPAGQVYLENEYGVTEGDAGHNHVVRQRQGSGESLFDYERVVEPFDHDYTDAQRPAFQTNFYGRNGQPVHYIYNPFGNLLLKEEQVVEGDRLRHLVWRYRYNRDGALLASLSPEGALTQYHYGRDQYLRRHGISDEEVATHSELTATERLAFGNLLAVVRRGSRQTFESMDLAAGVWGEVFPDVLGASDPDDAVVKLTYEEAYNQVLTRSDPRFTTRADPDALEPAAYQAALTRYEYAGPPGDPRRLLARVRRPDPTWPDGSQPGPVVDQFTDYDDHGRLLRQVDPAGTVTALEYFGVADGVREGFLRRRTVDPAGLAVTTAYDVDQLGRVTSQQAPRAAGAPAGHFVTHSTYNALDQLVQTTGSPPFNHVTTSRYDRNGQLQRVQRDAKDEAGADLADGPAVRTFRYDEELNLLGETVGGGKDPATWLTTRHHYDAAGKLAFTVTPGGRRTRRHYDERLLQVAVTVGSGTPQAAMVRAGYDGDGQQQRTTSARGYTATVAYDAFGRQIERRDPLGNLTRRTYDKAGNLTVERVFERLDDGTYALIARTEYAYDLLNRQVRRGRNLFQPPLAAADVASDYLASPGPGRLLVDQSFYDAADRLVRSVDPLGRPRQLDYDALGRMRAQVDPAGNRTEYRYDLNGNLTRQDLRELVRDPASGAVTGEQVFTFTAAYDELDRQSATADSLGNTTRYAHDSLGNQVRRTDPLGNVQRSQYDIQGRRRAHAQEMTATGLGGGAALAPIVTRFDYDDDANLVGITDPVGRHTTQLFDPLGRRHAIVYPDATRITYDYDADNNLIATNDNNGLRQTSIVDPLGRTVRTDVDRSHLPTDLIVEGADHESYTFDPLGRLRRHENDYARGDILVNSLGWPTQETLTLTTPAAPVAQHLQVRREFNDASALTGLTYPDGRTLRYDRDALDQVTRIQNLALGAIYPGASSTQATHDLATYAYVGRRRVHAGLGNLAETAWHYDGAGRVIDIHHTAVSHASILRIQQLVDGAGNLRLRNLISPGGSVADRFGYDSLYRLTQDDQSADPPPIDPASLSPSPAPLPDPIPDRQAAIDALIGPLGQASTPAWTYDPASNRLLEQLPGQPPTTYKVNDLDEYRAAGTQAFSYDQNGNRISDDRQLFRYDSMNRLVRVLDAATGADLAQFFHDAQGRRVLELTGGLAVHLVHDGPNLIAEYRAGTPFAHYVHNDPVDQPVQVAAEGAEHWYHQDPTGSVHALTDRTGALATTYRYTAFGGGTSAGGPYNPWRFAGRRLDAVLGDYDFRTRQYDPLLGRFLQRDSAGMIDGTNLYAYAGNNPLAFVDPLGMARERASMRKISKVSDMRHALASYGGNIAEARTTLGVLGVVLSLVWEPTAALVDMVRLPLVGDKDLDDYEPASDLAAHYLEETSREQTLGENVGARVHDTANVVTLGLASAPEHVKALAAAGTAPEDRGAALANLFLSGLAARGVARGFTKGPGASSSGVPTIALGEIKPIRSYRAGLTQLSMRGDVPGNTAIVTFEDTGHCSMQVFAEGEGGVRRIIWEGPIGQVPELPTAKPGTVGFGDEMEPMVRKLVEGATGQKFMPKPATGGGAAHGPDLIPVP